MSHSCPIGERSGDLLDQHNTLTTYRACWVTIGYEGARYPIEKHFLNDVYKSKGNNLNRQTDVQVCCQDM
ncbi:UNVERIFIED_CONTAM: hypothetical protein NCL1_39810 [Trichonephila clavipes]